MYQYPGQQQMMYPQQGMPMAYPQQMMYPQQQMMYPQQGMPMAYPQVQQPEEYIQEEVKPAEDNKNNGGGLNLGFFTSKDAKNVPVSTGAIPADKKPRKARTKIIDGQEVVMAKEDGTLPLYQTNEPYLDSYDETTSLLRSSIAQADQLTTELKKDIDEIRASKTIKNKYTYLTNLTASESGLISTKISAIKEISSIITNAHNLDLKRIKDMKLESAKGEANDDQRIMNMYDAFINTPIGTYSGGVMGPSMQDLTGGIGAFQAVDISNSTVPGYMPTGPMSPEQHRMRMENNPNMQTVVMFDQSTGKRWFDVIDRTTGAPVPNVSKPDEFILEDTVLDVNHAVAKNRNIDTTWPLMLVGSGVMSEY